MNEQVVQEEYGLSSSGWSDEEVIRSILACSPIVHDWRDSGENDVVVLAYVSNKYIWIITHDKNNTSVHKYRFDAIDQLNPPAQLILQLLVEKRYGPNQQVHELVAAYVAAHITQQTL